VEELINMSKYELVKKPISNRNQFKVTIVADSNDADYITEINTYSKDSFERYVLDGLIDLKNNFSDDNQLEKYRGSAEVPYSEHGRCHSLESISIEYTDEDGTVWDVNLK
jgi:hypothetical protein